MTSHFPQSVLYLFCFIFVFVLFYVCICISFHIFLRNPLFKLSWPPTCLSPSHSHRLSRGKPSVHSQSLHLSVAFVFQFVPGFYLDLVPALYLNFELCFYLYCNCIAFVSQRLSRVKLFTVAAKSLHVSFCICVVFVSYLYCICIVIALHLYSYCNCICQSAALQSETVHS